MRGTASLTRKMKAHELPSRGFVLRGQPHILQKRVDHGEGDYVASGMLRARARHPNELTRQVEDRPPRVAGVNRGIYLHAKLAGDTT